VPEAAPGETVECLFVTRYVAFLRGINVGGHTVKMGDLRRHFEDLGFGSVGTFIASGNVIFETDEADSTGLERRIERALREALGYEVATFLRTDAEVGAIARREPFADLEARDRDTQYVAFLPAPPDAATRGRIEALSNEQDEFRLHGRELHWLRRGNLSETTIGDAEFKKAFGSMPTTVRNVNTLRRLAAKLPEPRA
jgi:uncharacterized protein (DUF1697 family)